MSDRAILFIDGSNWYHSLKNAQVEKQGQLDYIKIAKKLAGPREWVGTRYYVGQVQQTGNGQLHAEQRRFISRFENAHPQHSAHFGRIERRTANNEAASELIRYLSSLSTRIDIQVFRDLMDLGQRHQRAEVMVEKAVDVMLAVDLVVMAGRNEFDTAYILSADGDFTHAVRVVRDYGKKVFAVSGGHGAQLAAAVNNFIHIDAQWIASCYQ